MPYKCTCYGKTVTNIVKQCLYCVKEPNQMLLTNRLILGIFLCFSFLLTHGQEYSLSGKVIDENNQPLSFVTILLSKQIANSDFDDPIGTSTNDDGSYSFDSLESGTYKLIASFIGFKTVTKTITLNKNTSAETITLVEDAQTLNQVELTVRKPTVKRSADKLTFNIANTALSEGDMLQALRSTPGILVMDGNLSIKGNEPTVYINNKKVQLSTDELSQLLESSSASGIKSIEVITNPSARFDAESGAVVNIIMTKNLVTGYRGSIFSNFTQGVFPRYQSGTSHSVKNKDISFTANYSFTKSKINRDTNDEINYFDASETSIAQVWNSNINRNTWSETHNLNLNFDWFIDSNNTLSLSNSTLYLPYFKYRIDNSTQITDGADMFLSSFTSDNLVRDTKHNIGFDLTFNHQFKNGASLVLNGHFTTYDYQRQQGVISNFFDSSNQFTNASAFNTLSNQDTKIVTSKADYSTSIGENGFFETGIKFSNVETKSNIDQFDIDLASGNSMLDVLNTDAFDYDEYVYAAYSNYSLESEKWSISLGLRAEQTTIDALSRSTNQNNDQDYLEWFPNASIQHTFSDNFSMYATYKRSLTRPNYTSLNPFNFFINENTIVTGNPRLVPTFLDHYVFGVSLLDLFTIEAYYQNYDGSIIELPRQNNTTNILEYTFVNLDKTVDYGFDFAVDFNLFERWNIYAITSFYNISEETKINDDFVELDQWSNYSILSNNISLLKDNSLNINLDLTWVGKNLHGLQRVEDRLFSSLAISKSLFKKRAILSLTIEDLFNFQDQDYETRYLNQFSANNVDVDNRYIGLGFRYKFGNISLQKNTKELTEEEENDQKRLNSSSANN